MSRFLLKIAASSLRESAPVVERTTAAGLSRPHLPSAASGLLPFVLTLSLVNQQSDRALVNLHSNLTTPRSDYTAI